MSLTGLSGLSALSGVIGGSGALLPGETFDWLYKVGDSPATNVRGRHTATYDGNTTGNFVDYLNAAAAKTLFEQIYGEVSVSLIDKGYRVRVISPTGNLADPTNNVDLVYPLNDGTGTAPNKTSQRGYATAISAVKEQVRFGAPVVNDTEAVTISNGSLTGGVVYDNVGTITSEGNPSGFSTLTGTGVGFSVTTWRQTFAANVDDFTISGGGPGSIGSYTQGVAGISAVAEVFRFDIGPSDGTVIFSSGSLTASGGSIASTSNPSGYSVTLGGGGFTFVEFTRDITGSMDDITVVMDDTGSSSYGVITQGVDGVSEQFEEFTYTTGGPISRSASISNNGGLLAHTIAWTSNLISSISTNPPGFSILSGGIGSAEVVWEQDSGSAIVDYTMFGDDRGAFVTIDQQGVSGVDEVLGQCIIGFTGAAGYVTFSDGFAAVPIALGTADVDIVTLLNGATAYNDSLVEEVVKASNSWTINYVAEAEPAGTITIGGRTGAGVSVHIVNIQDGE